MSDTIFKTASRVTVTERRSVMRQRGAVVWFTGLSGSGKSTLATALEKALVERGHPAFLLDGDNLRGGLCKDLGFDPAGRQENIRRASAVAALMADAGLICITAFISPHRAAREAARQHIGSSRFVEVHVCTPLTECEKRDCKGLYARARAGEVRDFTGISSPYEVPEHPDLAIDTSRVKLDEAIEQVISLLDRMGVWEASPS